MKGIKYNSKLIDKRIICPIIINNVTIPANSSYISLGTLSGKCVEEPLLYNPEPLDPNSIPESDIIERALIDAGTFNFKKKGVFNQPYLEFLQENQIPTVLNGILRYKNNFMGIYVEYDNTVENNYRSIVEIFDNNTKTPFFTNNNEKIYGKLIFVYNANLNKVIWKLSFHYKSNSNNTEQTYTFQNETIVELNINYVFPFALVPEDFAIRIKNISGGNASNSQYAQMAEMAEYANYVNIDNVYFTEKLVVNGGDFYNDGIIGNIIDENNITHYIIANLSMKPKKLFGNSSLLYVNGYTIQPTTKIQKINNEIIVDGYYHFIEYIDSNNNKKYALARINEERVFPSNFLNFSLTDKDLLSITYQI